tara:strand:- start:10010 stop:10639 length:630 start_codon:yes stop_codon:yes gene_type:complete
MTAASALIIKIRNRTNLSTDDARVSDTDLLDFINAAIQDCESQKEWPWREKIETITINKDDNDYTPAADWKTTLSLTLDDPPAVLQRRTWKWTRRLAWNNLKGTPIYYTDHAGVFYLYPVPDAAYTMKHRYLETVDVLGSTSATVSSPDWFDPVIVTKASSYVAQKLRDSELYQMLETQYKQQIQGFADDVSRTYEPVTVATRRDWEYG